MKYHADGIDVERDLHNNNFCESAGAAQMAMEYEAHIKKSREFDTQNKMVQIPQEIFDEVLPHLEILDKYYRQRLVPRFRRDRLCKVINYIRSQ